MRERERERERGRERESVLWTRVRGANSKGRKGGRGGGGGAALTEGAQTSHRLLLQTRAKQSTEDGEAEPEPPR